ncbi:hypothetical protein D3C80_2162960 [compost metagenome]
MVQREGQQAPGQFDQCLVDVFRVTRRVGLQVSQHWLVRVQGIEQPEERHIGNGKIGHALVALPPHAHQALALGG